MEVVDAKQELMNRTYMVMCPPMVDSFIRLFEEAKKQGRGAPLKTYQKLLQEVKSWSDTMIRAHTEQVENNCDYFTDLIKAVFVSHIKVLNSVRTRDGVAKITMAIPANHTIVHTIYIELAKDIYKSPRFMLGTEDQAENDLITRSTTAINNGIRALIPWKHVLMENIGTGVIGDGEVTEEGEFDKAPEAAEEPQVGQEPEAAEEPQVGQEPEAAEEPQVGQEPGYSDEESDSEEEDDKEVLMPSAASRAKFSAQP